MNDSYTTVEGNVTFPPQQKFGKEAGTPFVTFGIAQNRTRRDANGDIVGAGTSFYEVIAFRALGTNALDSVRKGEPVVVHGRLRISDWDEDGHTRTKAQIDATSIGHNLTFGTTEFTKRRKAAPPSHDRVDVEVNGSRVQVSPDGEVVGDYPTSAPEVELPSEMEEQFDRSEGSAA